MEFAHGDHTLSMSGVRRARDRIGQHLAETPLYGYPSLSRLLSADVLVKHENHLPVGAFKVRGGINLVSQMSDEDKQRGVIAASTGNHGQSVAYAARMFEVEARICVPEGANRTKVRSMQDLGAEVIFYGANFDEARRHCESLAESEGYRYIHSGDEPDLIEGVATHTLEIVEAEADVDTIIVPIGGGSGAAGTCLVAKSEGRDIEVVGVQSDASPSAYLSWKEGRPVEADNRTIAEGLATGAPFELPQAVLREYLDEFVLVGDDDIVRAQKTLIETTRNLVEAAGAAPLAAALALKGRLADKKVVLICSGGNVTIDQLRHVLG